MVIRLKSNRKFMINICLPVLIIGILATGILTLGLFFAKDINDVLPSFLVTLILTILFVVIILAIYLIPKPSFEFDQKEIKIIKKQQNSNNKC